MDDADLSEPKIEAAIEEGIKHSRWMLANKSLVPCHACYFCGEYLHAGELFCEGCDKDYEKLHKMKRITGR